MFEDQDLRGSLSDIAQADAFVERLVAIAQANAVELRREDLIHFFKDDPLGLSRFAQLPANHPSRPQPGWLPIRVFCQGDHLGADWAFFGRKRLSEPFFEDSIRQVLNRPFNKMFRFRLPLSEVPRWADALPSVRPSGFIFHASRCGSTLAAQMLGALPQNIVVSEAGPIDAAVQLGHAGGLDAGLLRAMVMLFGQRRTDSEARYFVKLDSWHSCALALFRQAFPSVPWVFLYREPHEILASQARQRGAQMTPELFSPSFYGLEFPPGVPGPDYHARVLARVCDAVLAELPKGNGRLINYRQLPQALSSEILAHFGVTPSADDLGAMTARARFSAKVPQLQYASDSDAGRPEAMDAARAAADLHVGEIYRRLEARRLASAMAGGR